MAANDFALYCGWKRATQLDTIVNKCIYIGAYKIHICIHWRRKESYMAQLWRKKVRLIGIRCASNWESMQNWNLIPRFHRPYSEISEESRSAIAFF